jgi:TonB family protein
MNEILSYAQGSLLLLASWMLSIWAFKLELPFRWQRGLLVGGLLLSTLPLLRMAVVPYLSSNPAIEITLRVVDVGVVTAPTASGISTAELLWWLYAAGVLLSLVPGLWSLGRVLFWLYNGKRQPYKQSTLIFTGSSRHGLCSFGRWIFIPGKDQSLPSNLLLAHELAHVQSWHSADKLLMQLLLALFWLFPPVYLLRKQLELLHELEADAAATRQYNAFDYALELSAYRLGVPNTQLINPFFKSNHQLLTRINMLNKTMNRRHLWLAPAALSLLLAVACTQGVVSNQDADKPSSEKVYAEEEELMQLNKFPEFVGGDEALMSYMAEHIKYPEKARADSIEGIVLLTFTVDKNGKIKDGVVTRGVHPLLDEAALSVLNSMPNWEPGEKDSIPVNVQFHLPIRFKL